MDIQVMAPTIGGALNGWDCVSIQRVPLFKLLDAVQQT